MYKACTYKYKACILISKTCMYNKYAMNMKCSFTCTPLHACTTRAQKV